MPNSNSSYADILAIEQKQEVERYKAIASGGGPVMVSSGGGASNIHIEIIQKFYISGESSPSETIRAVELESGNGAFNGLRQALQSVLDTMDSKIAWKKGTKNV
jgi:hypothetical protein